MQLNQSFLKPQGAGFRQGVEQITENRLVASCGNRVDDGAQGM
jgi:hypothetical protein